uniref:Uncharacterized protein n=1 Tax=Anguilla anguilla TaxID=7936 RepID=A0A0E9X0Q2_ANGAN
MVFWLIPTKMCNAASKFCDMTGLTSTQTDREVQTCALVDMQYEDIAVCQR